MQIFTILIAYSIRYKGNNCVVRDHSKKCQDICSGRYRELQWLQLQHTLKERVPLISHDW